MRSPIRILLVDDHSVVRAGYRRFLEQEPDCQVVGEASSGEEAYALLQTIEPDVVILDVSMPGQGGLSVLRRMKLRWPLLPVLIFSMHDNLPFVVQALRAGANGYITKSSEPESMVKAVRSVVSGVQALSADVASKMALAQSSTLSQPTLGLSAREFEIFRLVAGGKTHEAIAELLNVSVKTVANNHSLIRQKLGISTDIELYRLARDCGAVEAVPA
ncbi:MAG: response regulator transcription factor [Proteobacteria bacterium]|nr:response regulator transcription factor [Pseudomonadota bacterium]